MAHASTLPKGNKPITQGDAGALHSLDTHKPAYERDSLLDTNSRIMLKDIPPPDESLSHPIEAPSFVIPPPSSFIPKPAEDVLPPVLPPLFNSFAPPSVTTASQQNVPQNYIFINNINEFSALPTSFRTSNLINPNNQYQSISETFYDSSLTTSKSIEQNKQTLNATHASNVESVTSNTQNYNISEQQQHSTFSSTLGESLEKNNSIPTSETKTSQESTTDIPPPLPDHGPPPLYSSTSDEQSYMKIRTLSTDLYMSSEEIRIKPPIKPLPPPKPVAQTNPHAEGTGSGLGKWDVFSGAHQQPPQSPKSNATKTSVSDRKKFFENAMEESQKPSPKPERVFSYLSADEIEKLKAEEEKKIATLSRAEIGSLSGLDHSDDESVDSQPTRPASTIGIVRTAKAEKRLRERMREEGLLTDEDECPLSPAEERALRAEKRAAWRQARLKSLEQDAIQAQMVIKSMTDMVGVGVLQPTIEKAESPELRPSSADFPKLAVRTKPGNTTVRESEKVLGETITRRTEEFVDDTTGEKCVRTVEYVEKLIEREVETLQEKIISLELTKPTELNLEEVPVNGNDEGEETVSEPATPTTSDEKVLGENSATSNKKKKRKRSKKGKH